MAGAARLFGCDIAAFDRGDMAPRKIAPAFHRADLSLGGGQVIAQHLFLAERIGGELGEDRVGASRYLISVRRDEDIVNWVKENDFGGHSPAEDPAVRDKLAELWTEAQVCRLMTMRSMSLVNRDGNFIYEGSAEKVWAPEHGVKTTEAISQILGPYAQLLNGSEEAIEDGLYAHNLMGSFQSGINHGSVQIMRDQMARRGLGMPRG